MTALSIIAREALERAKAAARKRQHWTQHEEQLLILLYPNTPMPELIKRFGRPDRAIYQKARALNLRRAAEYLASEHACRLRREDNPGIETRFKSGHESWNAGMKGWTAGGRSAETRFQKGSRPHTWVPIGTEQLRDGYLWRKLTDNGGRHDWKRCRTRTNRWKSSEPWL